MPLTKRTQLYETPSQLGKIQDAITIIAEIRDSEYLRQFIACRVHPYISQPPFLVLYNSGYTIDPPETPRPQQPVESSLNSEVSGLRLGHNIPGHVSIRSHPLTRSLSLVPYPISHRTSVATSDGTGTSTSSHASTFDAYIYPG